MRYSTINCRLGLLVIAFSGLASAQERFPEASRSILGRKPTATLFSEDHQPGRLQIKFVHGTKARLVEGRLAAANPEVAAVDAQLEELGAKRERLWLQSDESLVAWRNRGEERSGRPLHDLTQFFGVTLPEGASVAEACDVLNQFEIVELAYPVGSGGDPSTPALSVSSPSSSSSLGNTPDYESLQDYRLPAPGGIDVGYAEQFPGGDGAGSLIADCETGWTDNHEDLAHAAEGNYVGLPPTFFPWDHGTAVLGELVGEDNGQGVKGICPAADARMSTHQGQFFATAIQAAADAVTAGDSVVIEIQCFGSAPGPFPCEFLPDVYAVVESATANGIHVFAAAGNGGLNLDGPAYGGLFDKNVRDSGSVIVGASDGASLNKAGFSNFGSRLDAHGWGQDVTTCAYGDLKSGPAQEEYTATFSGTSSATPIVTGAGVLLNSIHRAVVGSPLDPLVLRDLLTQTGTPQGSGGQIGPRPDLQRAIDEMLDESVIVYCTPKISSALCVNLISTTDLMAQPVSGQADYSVTCSDVQGQKNGLLFVGVSGPANVPFSGGTLCARPPLKRGPILNSGGSSATSCDGAFSVTVNDGQVVPLGLDAGAGNSGWYQWWYRDPQNGAGDLGTALSNAAELNFQ